MGLALCWGVQLKGDAGTEEEEEGRRPGSLRVVAHSLVLRRHRLLKVSPAEQRAQPAPARHTNSMAANAAMGPLFDRAVLAGAAAAQPA